ncbi:MAG: alpha/beta hydrolase [Alicyclobacillus sp.]|nr:alpha/beta hydrolase [Alicyclobacillus sp.]
MPEQLGFRHKVVTGAADHPALVLLHGTGGDEEDLLPVGELLDDEASLLGVRGQVLEGGSPRFFRRIAEGVFDEADLIFRTRELADFVAQARDAYQLNGRLVAVGYSNGANIAASTLFLRPGLFSGAILFRAMVPFQPSTLEQFGIPRDVDLRGLPVFLAAGRNDPLIPADNTERLAELLRAAGARVTLEWFTSGHALSRAELSLAHVWYHEDFLGNGESQSVPV